MGRKHDAAPFAKVHDHFDGSFHCVECAGPCKLNGNDLLLTQLVCDTMTLWAIRGEEPWGMAKHSLAHGLEHFWELWKRAKERNPKRIR